MSIQIGFEDGEKDLDWIGLTEALKAGHNLPKAEIADTFLYRGKDTLLNRSAWIDGLGLTVKCATVFPENPSAGVPMINGAVSLFDDAHGRLEAIIDFHLITKWKTAGDSLLGALRLARPDSRKILIIGSGTVARSLHDAYSAGYPEAKFTVWSRTHANAEMFAKERAAVVADDLEVAARGADIITSATMSTAPVLRGDWLQNGQHVDLIGAYRPDMREADDRALQRARVFVDSFDTTIGHIGEVQIPLDSGAISRADLIADYYSDAGFERRSDDEITLFKNGGGAHLDLMVSRYVLERYAG
ncbi:MAG: ornithine cyclodeaminase [Planktotalea sp.]|jgi:ornithine cyclodeaminase/alanine dehydrogenase-like protein (mu-crystallin family)|uniref:ornithine cyclodeaminase family protein n=1 Tax=Planktotalea sp. TaxID=2029877 RepID=UPI000EBBF509|nr:ornithine cyclodeaminase [Planktotalea sp.]MBT5823080.1 ornithine cyclodeaminase [Paracoccaceae bacterium]MDG1075279.1 ornithine cyclodeaminase [Planktotalea sp.]MDG1082828.1 ornithine cyclodeaminase [Planktotalea sp.]HCW82466.1 ornithine cyclodeaminase [Paracoccaceae bacterium]